MSFLRFLVAWGNVPFTIAGAIAILFALLQVTGVLGLVAGEADGDHDADFDHDVDHDVDHDGDGDHDAEAGGGFVDVALGTLGVGKIPLSIVWQSFAVVFAVVGIAWNVRAALGSSPSARSLLWTIPIAFAAAWIVVSILARLLAPILSSKAAQATSRAELIGETGVVISSKVTRDFGEVRIRDKTGHDLRVVCRLADGSKEPAEHQRVVVVEIEEARGEIIVAAVDD